MHLTFSWIKVLAVSSPSVKNLIYISQYLPSVIFYMPLFWFRLVCEFPYCCKHITWSFPPFESFWQMYRHFVCLEFLSLLIDFQILWESWEISSSWATVFLVFNSQCCLISNHVFSDNSSSSDHFFSLSMCFFPHCTLPSTFHQYLCVLAYLWLLRFYFPLGSCSSQVSCTCWTLFGEAFLHSLQLDSYLHTQ